MALPVDKSKIKHLLLKHQVGKASKEATLEACLDTLLSLVDLSYCESDRERKITEHSMAMMSEEVMEVNSDLMAQTLELVKTQERYALAANAANDGLWDWDIETGDVYYSNRFLETLGLENDASIKSFDLWMNIIHPDDQDHAKWVFKHHLKGDLERIEIEFQLLKGDEYIWCLSRGLASRDENGRAIRIAGSMTDITAQKQYEAELQRAAFHDDLTGLANRALFINRLEQVIEREKRLGEKPAAVLFVDLDKFKHINDTMGHEFGDAVLKFVAKVIKNSIRACDTVARLGGDEFTILLDSVEDIDDALLTANRLLEQLNRSHRIMDREIHISSSIGLTIIEKSSKTPTTILRNADLAMYHAKSKKSGKVEVFDTTQHQKLLERMETESDLRAVIKNSELDVHYQPIVSLETGQATSLEALVRWFHPQKGFISPAHFIPLAEESGMIGDIGSHVLKTVLNDLKKWVEQFGFDEAVPCGVNLSSIQLMDDFHFAGILKTLGDFSELLPKIRIEVTETAVMTNPELVKERLDQLRGLGIKLCIDDFGTGYSSLSYLHSYSYDVLKIDRSFITMITMDKKLERLVSNIINMSHDLNLEIVAEGIETEEQMLKLKDLGCQKGQGYLFAKAMNRKDATRLIASKSVFEAMAKGKKEVSEYNKTCYQAS